MGNICANLKCNDTKENNKCTHHPVKMDIISRKGQGAAGRTITEYQTGSKVFIITLDDMLHILRITTTVIIFDTLIYIATINHNFFMQDNKTGLDIRIIISIIIGEQIPNCNTVMKTKFFSFCLISRTQISNTYIITYLRGSPKCTFLRNDCKYNLLVNIGNRSIAP